MVSFTPRAKIPKQAPTGEVVDISVLNNGFDKIDELLGAFECTSTTRPNSPFIGMTIIETDTNVSRQWNGNRWSVIRGSDKVVDLTDDFFTPASGWLRSGISSGDGTGTFGYAETPGHYRYIIALRRSGVDVAVDGNGLVAGAAIGVGNIGAGFPSSGSYGMPINYQYRTSTGGVRSGQGRYNGRTIELISGQPNQVIAQRATDIGYSIIFDILAEKNNGIQL